MGNQKVVSRRKTAATPSHTADNALGGNPEDESQSASPRSATSVRDIIARRKSHNAKDQISKGAIEKSNAKAIQKQSRDKDREARQLVRWSPYIDQRLLLTMVYELKKMAIKIPWDEIGNRMSKERKTTGQSVIQHLTKVRIRMLNQGCWVPPLTGRTNSVRLPDIRGVVLAQDEDGNLVEKTLGWEDDLSNYTEPIDIDGDFSEMAALIPVDRLNPTGRNTEERNVKTTRNYPANRRKYNARRANPDSVCDTDNPDDLDSDDLNSGNDYDPMGRGKAKNYGKPKAPGDATANAAFYQPDNFGEGYLRGGMMSIYQNEKEQDGSETTSLQKAPFGLSAFPVGATYQRDVFRSKGMTYNASIENNAASFPVDSETSLKTRSTGLRLIHQPDIGFLGASAAFATHGIGYDNTWIHPQEKLRIGSQSHVRNSNPTAGPMTTNEHNHIAQGYNDTTNHNETTGRAVPSLNGDQDRQEMGEEATHGGMSSNLNENREYLVAQDQNANDQSTSDEAAFDESRFFTEATRHYEDEAMNESSFAEFADTNDSLDMLCGVGMMNGHGLESTFNFCFASDMRENTLSAHGGFRSFASTTAGQAAAAQTEHNGGHHCYNATGHHGTVHGNESIESGGLMDEHAQRQQPAANLGVDEDLSIDAENEVFRAEDRETDNDNEALGYEEVINPYNPLLELETDSAQLVWEPDMYPENFETLQEHGLI